MAKLWTTPSSGGLTNWTEAGSASTQQNASFTATNAATNVTAVLAAKGTGATQAQIPDGTSTGGNARGTRATDWQKHRSAGSMVASGADSTVSGGYQNTASGTYATVGGGRNNNCSTNYTTIAGGRNNTASGLYAAVGGGSGNTVGGGGARYATCAGGLNNTSSGYYSTTGGDSCTASGNRATAIGQSNTASGLHSIAFGKQTSVNKQGQFGCSAGFFAAIGDAQWSMLIVRNKTTDNTSTELFLDGVTATLRATIPSGKTWHFEVSVVARQTGGASGTVGDSAVWCYEGGLKNIAGVVSLVGTVQTIMAIQSEAAAAAWTVTITADDTNDSLKIAVAGETNKNISWVAKIELVEVL